MRSNPSRLSVKQQAVLLQLYKFRFGTSDLLARSLNLRDGRYIHTRLDTLVNKGYVGKNYDSSYKLPGKPASYYLLSPSLPALRACANEHINPRSLRNIYKDRTASERFIAHNLAVFAIYDRLTALFGPHIICFTKSELNGDQNDHFPERRPDLFVRLTKTLGTHPRPRRYMIYYLDDATPFFVHIRRVHEIIEYIEADEWESAMGTKLRGILLVCESTSLHKRIRRKIAQAVDEDDIPRICTTTLDALKHLSAADNQVWQIVGKPLELFGLEEL